MLRDSAKQEKCTTMVDIIRQIAPTGCRRSEVIRLKWTEADTEAGSVGFENSNLERAATIGESRWKERA